MNEELEMLLGKITNSKDLTVLVAELFKSTSDVAGLIALVENIYKGECKSNVDMFKSDTADVQESNSGYSFEKWISEFGVDYSL